MKYIKTYEIFDELMIIPQKTDKNIIVLILATQAEIEEFKIKLKANKYNL